MFYFTMMYFYKIACHLCVRNIDNNKDMQTECQPKTDLIFKALKHLAEFQTGLKER